MLTKEEFDKVLELQAEDLKVHVEEYINSKMGEGSDEDTRRVFPLALFEYSARLLLYSMVGECPDKMKADFIKMLSKHISLFVRAWNITTALTSDRAKP